MDGKDIHEGKWYLYNYEGKVLLGKCRAKFVNNAEDELDDTIHFWLWGAKPHAWDAHIVVSSEVIEEVPE